jgi:hypothetical protein
MGMIEERLMSAVFPHLTEVALDADTPRDMVVKIAARTQATNDALPSAVATGQGRDLLRERAIPADGLGSRESPHGAVDFVLTPAAGDVVRPRSPTTSLWSTPMPGMRATC